MVFVEPMREAKLRENQESRLATGMQEPFQQIKQNLLILPLNISSEIGFNHYFCSNKTNH